MEDPAEPEQKRLRRIGEYLEDEIARVEHFPIEELARHKAAMIHVLQFLSIEEAYSVSILSRRIYEWFQRNNIWFALAQRWLSPARLAQCEALVEQVKPKGARVNYLWLLLGEYMMRFQPLPTWATTRFMIYNNRRNPVYYFGADVRVHYDSAGVLWMEWDPSQEWRHASHSSTLVDRGDLLGKFYRYMIDHPNAFVAFAFQGAMKVLIRNRLNNPI